MRWTGKQSGFTVIELMVVVTVLVALICLVTPAIRLVRIKAHDTRCVNNLHQLSMAIKMYSDHWGGYAPGTLVFIDPIVEENAPLPGGFALMPSACAVTLESDRPDCVSHYYKETRLIDCPRAYSRPTYGLNRELATVTCTLRNIVHPSVVPLVFDSGVHLGATYSDLAYRHFMQANAAMADGHVEKIRFFPERVFPDLVLLPGPYEDPGDHPGMDPGEYHGGSFPVDPDEQADDSAYEGNIEVIQWIRRTDEYDRDAKISNVEFLFKNMSKESVALTWFSVDYSRRGARFDAVKLDGNVLYDSAVTGERGKHGAVFHFTSTVIPAGGTFTIRVEGLRKPNMKHLDVRDMRKANFVVTFSNGSAALIPGVKVRRGGHGLN
jgi:prepilin-type N-terminal cleavage/methylation domain-containing protein/prepilin-type processing-associated H-X9-DG protein